MGEQSESEVGGWVRVRVGMGEQSESKVGGWVRVRRAE